MSKISLYKKWGWVFHILFWIFFGLLSFLIYQIALPNKIHALLPTGINLLGLIIMVYVHLNILLPRYFGTKKYIHYTIGVIILLLLSSIFRFYGGWGLVTLLEFEYHHFFTPYFFASMMVSGSFLLVITMPLYLVEHWFKKLELEAQLKTQQLEAELRFLKAQVNPHFLFNALNNIYSLSFIQSKKAPEMILKLSDMMSYMLYECKSEWVALSAEIDYLNNYIDLQQLKKDGEQQIEFLVEGEIGNLKISPMLFIPFFENVFKHGNLEDTRHGWMKSKLTVKKGEIDFTIANSLLNDGVDGKKGGVGLENIRKRLNLIYPDQHSLFIEQKDQVFSVSLALNLKKSNYALPMSISG